MAAKSLDEFLAKHLTPAEIAAVKRDTERTVRALRTVRVARHRTQMQLSSELGIAQGEVSKIERRADLYVSTLRRYVEALGGELILSAKFGDEIVDLALAPEPAKRVCGGPEARGERNETAADRLPR